MQDAPFWAMPQPDPMGPPVGVQFPPLQHKAGLGAVCGVHTKPGAHPPVVSQRQPWLPTMHVEATPSVPEPPSLPELPGTQRPLPLHIMPLPQLVSPTTQLAWQVPLAEQ
jgi:hypothetical protein